MKYKLITMAATIMLPGRDAEVMDAGVMDARVMDAEDTDSTKK